MVSAMLPLDRALLSFYSNHYSNGLAAICNTNFYWGSDPQISHPRGKIGPLSNTVLLVFTRVSLPVNIIIILSLEGCTSMNCEDGQTYIHTYRQTYFPRAVTSVATGGMGECFQRSCVTTTTTTIIIIMIIII